jgi:TolB-like protein/DNA-binding winged helix-turn-helix (wHTH) protein
VETVRRTGRVRFGPFEADLSSGELRKHSLKVKLQDQPFQVLALLLERPGEVVTREELRQKLWPADTFVDFDVGLNTAIKRLRDALGDTAESPRYVETLPRRGYRFIAQVDGLAAATPPSGPAQIPTDRYTRRAVSALVDAVLEAHGARTRWRVGAVVAGATALAMAVVLFSVPSLRQRVQGKTIPPKIQSLAVLPLENLSGDPAQEYFADGMTDALVTDLAQISSLRVISRTSVMRYKGTRKPLPDIAKELNVDGIVEGTVVRSAERVRVNVQLIQATTDRHVWASAYERSLGDVVVLQSEVAQAIANAIQVQLTPEEQARLARKQSVDPQAYEFYLKGRYFWNKRTDAAVRKSIDYFQQAIQRDPNYALAYAGIADAYVVRTDLSPEEKFSKSKAMAKVALQMNETLAEAHNAMAMSLFSYDWDWAGAEKEFQRGIALNPNYAMAHQWYGQFQRAMGRQNWAAEVKRAHELDPLSLVIAGGDWYLESGQYDLAIEHLRKRLELDPDFALTYLLLGNVYARKGMYQDAIAQLQKGVQLSGGAPYYLSALGYTYGVSGKRDEALKILQQLTLLSKRRYVSPYEIARVYVGLGENDLAFDWLQKALVDRSSELVFLKVSRGIITDTMRSDPRYIELVRRIGLP